MRITARIFFIITLLIALPATAQDFQKGKVAYDQGDYSTALKEWSHLAQRGIPLAQNNLGVMYENGYGVPQDYKKAFEFYSKAAVQGFGLAQNNLGAIHQAGHGVPQDYKKAIAWFREAAKQGEAIALYNLGFSYERGFGVPKDYREAAIWYQSAAKKGFSKAQYNLGVFYARGLGVPQDYSEAAKFYKKAAEQGLPEAQFNLGLFYAKGRGVAVDFIESAKLLRKAAAQGLTQAKKVLKIMISKGLVPKPSTAASHPESPPSVNSKISQNPAPSSSTESNSDAKKSPRRTPRTSPRKARVHSALPECDGSPLTGPVSGFASWDGCQGTVVANSPPKYAGDKYVGEFRNGNFNRQGTYVWANGDEYVGEWRNGKPRGQGTINFAKSGDKYVGEWRNGKKHGQGTFYFAKSGNKYVGEFRNRKKHGQGTYTYAKSGDTHAGEYKNGKKHGQGTYTYAKSGDKYVGEYRNGKRHGPGTYKFANGRVTEGMWKNGKFEYSKKVTPSVTARKRSRRTPKRKLDPNKIIRASSGSGFAVSNDGHVITNDHVIKGCKHIKIHHQGKSIAATVITFDPRNDLALLKGNFHPSTVFPLSNDKPELLQDVYVAGYPFGRKVSTSIKVTKGIISSLTGIGNNFSNIQIDAALQPGNSGGPILDDKGNVVGVAVARLDKMKVLKKFGSLPENTNFGIKTSVVRNILESSNVSLPRPNTRSISKSKLGKAISNGIYYLSCWMTVAQIQKMKSKKVMFNNLD